MSESRSGSISGLNNITKGSRQVFHYDGTIMVYINYTVTRSSEQQEAVRWEVSWSTTRLGTYGYTLWADLWVSGEHKTITFINNGTITDGSIAFYSDTPSNTAEFAVIGKCNSPNYGQSCNHGDWSNGTKATDTNWVTVPPYVEDTPATNVQRGKVYTTRNTNPSSYGANVKDKPSNEIWFDWWGQSNGINNPITRFDVDFSKTNSSSGAVSIGSTTRYTQNTHINIMSLCTYFNLKIGDTLYCWVNTYVSGHTNAWLGRVYIGSITLVKDGKILVKDSNGNVKECQSAYYRDGSGNKRTMRYVVVKDSNNVSKIIDTYSTLYE